MAQIKCYGGPKDGDTFYVSSFPEYLTVAVFPIGPDFKKVNYNVYPYSDTEAVAFPTWMRVERFTAYKTMSQYVSDSAYSSVFNAISKELARGFWGAQDRENCFIVPETVVIQGIQDTSVFGITYSLQGWAIRLFPEPELAKILKYDRIMMVRTYPDGRQVTDEEWYRTTVDADPDVYSTEVEVAHT